AVAFVAAGCASAQAAHSGAGAPATATPAPARTPGTGPPGTSPPPPPPGTGATMTITLAGNQKTYTIRVGDRVRVYLRGTRAQRWLTPLASGIAVAPVADPAGTLQIGVTGGSFAAVRPGRAVVTSVRPPCRVAIPAGTNGVEPAFPLHQSYPVQDCAPGRRFTVWINVLR
ncbi:MAG TPA: hypothetical protein VGN41_26180, partial [Streptosporangiaceae bacterium]